jgi:hypothetical protein
VIFTHWICEALTPKRKDVGLEKALGISVQRYPLFFADFDASAGQVTLTMETPHRHTWGTIAVPAF